MPLIEGGREPVGGFVESGALAAGEGEQSVAHSGVGAGVVAGLFGSVCCGEPGAGGLEVVDDVGHGAGGERGAQPAVPQFDEGVDIAGFVVGEAFEVGAQGGGDGLLVAGPAVQSQADDAGQAFGEVF
ncbi:hypothetical protein [Streptomyces sp. NPDC001966]